MVGEQGLKGQTAIVTGGTGGIGRAACLALAGAGANVVAVDVSRDRLDALIDEIGTAARDVAALGLALDVRSEHDMEEMARRTIERFGGVDILVACAGILRPAGASLRTVAQLTTEEWDAIIGTNLKGVFLSNRAVLANMIERRRGNIVNISSVSGRQGRAHDAAYCASKFGVIGLSESLAEEVRQYGVRVQVLLPDAVDTPMWDQNGPVPRPGNALPADRIAGMILYMLALPPDTILQGPIIAAFRTRRRTPAPGAGRGEPA